MIDRETYASAAQHVLIHCVRSMAQVSPVPQRGIDLGAYSHRSLVAAKPGDLVLLHEPVEPAYLEYLNQLGLGPRSDDVIVCPDLAESAEETLFAKLSADRSLWNRLLDRLQSAAEVVLHPYMSTPWEHALAEQLQRALPGAVKVMSGNYRPVQYYDQKHHVRELAQRLGIPVAPGEVVTISGSADWFRLEAAIRHYRQRTGKVIVRGASGNSGTSLQVFESTKQIVPGIRHLLQHDENSVYLVEAMVRVTHSPNVGMYIAPLSGEVSCYSTSDQLFGEGLDYAGNQSPVDCQHMPEMIAAAQRLAEHLSRRGVRGHLGVDFCQHQSPLSGTPYLLAELNPRVNGATYSQSLLNSLNRVQQRCEGSTLTAYQTQTLATCHRSYAELKRSVAPLLFEAGASAGVIPLQPNLLAQGKCGFALVATQAEQLPALHEQLRNRLVRTNEHLQRAG